MLAAVGSVRTYEEIWSEALRLASMLIEEARGQKLIGFLADRDQSAYLAILSILAAGKGYVPLSPSLPDARLVRIVREAQLKTVIVGSGQAARAASLAGSLEGTRLFIDLDGDGELPAGDGRSIIGPRDIASATPRSARPDTDGAAAYLLFTSGSTGEPKGVAVTNANLCAYLDFACRFYRYGPDDCHTQTFELTFDLSVHDMMCAWTTGGKLAPIVRGDLLSPARIVRREQVTCWFSV